MEKITPEAYNPTIEKEFEGIKIDTKIEGATEEDYLMITSLAMQKIKEFMAENNVPDDFSLRFAARSGGCSGMIYRLGLDNNYEENDRKMVVDGINIVVDSKSIFYLMGVTLDFVDDIQGSGFIFVNPFNENTCGCSH
jgi:iron-sulfur cluster assembly protein